MVNKLFRNYTKLQLIDNLEKNECIICMNKFNSPDEISLLDCDKRHIFHTICIKNWILKGRQICPFCRKSINLDYIERF